MSKKNSSQKDTQNNRLRRRRMKWGNTFQHYQMREGPPGGFLEGKPFTDAFPSMETSVEEKQKNVLSKTIGAPITQKAVLENMWLTAFKDVDKETHQSRSYKLLRDRLDLPGGGVMPSASEQMRFVSKLRKKARQRKEARKNKRERLGGSAACEHKTLDEFIKRAELILKQEERDEAQRVRWDRRRRTKKKKKKTNPRVKTSKQVSLGSASTMRRANTLYNRVGRRIRKGILSSRATKVHVKDAKSTAEELYHLQHRLTKAAITVQRFRRSFVEWREKVHLARSNSSAVVLQRHARGMIARSLLTRWWARRIYLVCVLQGTARGVLQRRLIRVALREEYQSVIKIQTCWRRYAAKRRVAFERLAVAAIKIQKRWRGTRGRCRAHRRWLDTQVIKIQKVVRGFIHGKVLYMNLRSRVDRAATQIQRAFRSFSARKMRDELLFARHIDQRLMYINQLRSLAGHMTDAYGTLERESTRSRVRERLKDIQEKELVRRGEVYQTEFDYLAFFREKACLTPRAVMQGYSKEIEENIKTYRKKVTNDKLDILFNVSRESRRLEETNEMLDETFEELRFEMGDIERVREKMLATHYARVEHHAQRRRARLKRQNLAEQKRRWSVRYFRPSGKPDRKRRYGRPWDKSVFTDPLKEKMVLTGDFFTIKTDAMGKCHVPLSQSVQLRNCFNQFQQYGAMLKPLMSRMGTVGESLGAGTPSSRQSRTQSSNDAATAAKEEEEDGNIRRQGHTNEDDDAATDQEVDARTSEMTRKRNMRRMARRRYRPTRKVWDILDELEKAKSPDGK